MAATIAQIRDGLMVRINTVSGVKAYDTATGNERLDTPVAIIFPRPSGRQETPGDAYRLWFVIEVHVPIRVGLAEAQNKLDALIDPRGAQSIEAAIYSGETLSGIVDWIKVHMFERYVFSTLNEQQTIMAHIPVEVMSSV
jgi:hypothetical protein